VVKNLIAFGGYTREDTVVSYKDVSMDGCQLRYTTFTAVGARYTDSDSFAVPLDSLDNLQWGTLNRPTRGYVMWTVKAPISFSHQRTWLSIEHKPETYKATTTFGYLELGQPAADQSDIARQMKMSIVHAADICKAEISDRNESH
jgi:hypothetical protein